MLENESDQKMARSEKIITQVSVLSDQNQDEDLDSQKKDEDYDKVDELPPCIQDERAPATILKSAVPSTDMKLDFHEKHINVKISLFNTKNGNIEILNFPLFELKQSFYQKRKHCKLDWQFVYWDIKLKKYKKQYEQQSKVVLNEAKNAP